jgi:hypothetical protein
VTEDGKTLAEFVAELDAEFGPPDPSDVERFLRAFADQPEGPVTVSDETARGCEGGASPGATR